MCLLWGVLPKWPSFWLVSFSLHERKPNKALNEHNVIDHVFHDYVSKSRKKIKNKWTETFPNQLFILVRNSPLRWNKQYQFVWNVDLNLWTFHFHKRTKTSHTVFKLYRLCCFLVDLDRGIIDWQYLGDLIVQGNELYWQIMLRKLLEERRRKGETGTEKKRMEEITNKAGWYKEGNKH